MLPNVHTTQQNGPRNDFSLQQLTITPQNNNDVHIICGTVHLKAWSSGNKVQKPCNLAYTGIWVKIITYYATTSTKRGKYAAQVWSHDSGLRQATDTPFLHTYFLSDTNLPLLSLHIL